MQYSWDGAPAIYKGIVESVPEVRGKTLRAEVRVENAAVVWWQMEKG